MPDQWCIISSHFTAQAHVVCCTIPCPCRETVRGRIAGERRRRDSIFSRSVWLCGAVQPPSAVGSPRCCRRWVQEPCQLCLHMICEVFDVLGYRFHRDGKGFQGAECTMCKALRSWWRDKYTYRAKTVINDGHVQTRPQSCAQHSAERQHQLAVEWTRCVRGEGQILRLTFRPRMRPDETWVGHKIRTSRIMRVCWRKIRLPLLT